MAFNCRRAEAQTVEETWQVMGEARTDGSPGGHHGRNTTACALNQLLFLDRTRKTTFPRTLYILMGPHHWLLGLNVDESHKVLGGLATKWPKWTSIFHCLSHLPLTTHPDWTTGRKGLQDGSGDTRCKDPRILSCILVKSHQAELPDCEHSHRIFHEQDISIHRDLEGAYANP